MRLRYDFANCVLRKFAATAVVLCLFACSLPAAAAAPPSMGEQEVHSTVAKLGVGKTVSLRVSSSGPGPVQYTYTSGRIASISESSFELRVGRGHHLTERTLAFKDVDEIHGTGMSAKDIVIGLVVVGAVFTAIIVWDSRSVQH